jgi:hypothetical protein
MIGTRSCVIDNWSLEQTAFLLETDGTYYFKSDDEFIKGLGGLSNFISAVLLYEDSKFIVNGNHDTWHRFEWFKDNVYVNIKPYIPDEMFVYWMNYMNNNLGIDSYLITSKYLKSDLFISPFRAEKVISFDIQPPQNPLVQILSNIDNEIGKESKSSWFNDIKIGIEQNFILPSLTQYVFSEASNKEDLLRVILQLKDSNRFTKIKDEILELLNTSKDIFTFQKDVQNIVHSCFGKSTKNDKSLAIKISILFLTFTKSFGKENIIQNQYLTFLRDLITCRSEAYHLQKNIQRIFKRKIDFSNSNLA